MSFSFFFNDTATTEIYTLSLHDALPISRHHAVRGLCGQRARGDHRGRLHARAVRGRHQRLAPDLPARHLAAPPADRKSTRLNSSHANISYAVFCLKKKKVHQIKRIAYYD